MLYTYKGFVDRVKDGDTYIITVNLGFGISFKTTFRLLGVDTPETWRPKTKKEKLHGKKATNAVKNLIENKNVIVKTKKDKTGKFGRFLCDIITIDGTIISGYLKENDLVKRRDYE